MFDWFWYPSLRGHLNNKKKGKPDLMLSIFETSFRVIEHVLYLHPTVCKIEYSTPVHGQTAHVKRD